MIGTRSCGLSVTANPDNSPTPAIAAMKPRSNSRLRNQPDDDAAAFTVVADMANCLPRPTYRTLKEWVARRICGGGPGNADPSFRAPN